MSESMDQELGLHLRAGYRVLAFETFEEDRALRLLERAAERNERVLHTWSLSSGWRGNGCDGQGCGSLDAALEVDVDCVSDGERVLSAPEYFTRLSQQVVSLLDEVTSDGFVFRTDTRLRPFGDSGPPVVSFAALESYLVQHGRGWERYAYVKARIVGPMPSRAVATDLVGTTWTLPGRGYS